MPELTESEMNGRSVMYWAPFVWLLLLPTLFVAPLMNHSALGVWIPTIASSIIFVPLYFHAHRTPRLRERMISLVLIAIPGFALLPVNPSAAVFLVYSATLADATRPFWRGVIVFVFSGIVAFFESMLTQHSLRIAAWTLFFIFATGIVSACLNTMCRTSVQLREAQAQIAELAVTAERMRIARDLHDLLGHTLSLITLKSSLASRIAESDSAHSLREIREVEQVSREALAQVRAVVAGYRESHLTSELASAARLLDAANVALEANIPEFSLNRAEEQVLAAALREGVTNIVRHARAHTCIVSLLVLPRNSELLIRDDGVGSSGPEGNGLVGIRERVEALHGSVTLSVGRGSTLRIVIPRQHRSPDHSIAYISHPADLAASV